MTTLAQQERMARRMQQVLVLRYLHEMTLEEVGRRLGCTRERVRQIELMASRILMNKPGLRQKVCDILNELDQRRTG